MIFDSHAHYDDAVFDPDRDALLAALPQEGVCGVVNAGASLDSSLHGLKLAEQYPYFYAAVGIHPEYAATFTDDTAAALSRLTAHPRVVAIGEIGLDYHFPDGAPREVQLQVFERQLQLAAAHHLPVIIHDRDAHADTMDMLKKYRPTGVIHCFSGSVEMMREAVSLGLYIGLGGAVTFKGARKPAAVAAAVPSEFLLLETDAPYMAPVPCRGQRCDSRLIAHTAAAIAALRGTDTASLLKTTADNARRLFGL